MAVYFIQAGENGPVKIGHTIGSVQRRLAQIQSSSPWKMILLRQIRGDFRTEREMRNRFSHCRLDAQREWFRFDDAMLTVGKSIQPVEEVRPPPRTPRTKKTNNGG